MPAPANPLTLADWRQRVADLYAEVRAAPRGGEAAACIRFRRGRDELFRTHPDSPVDDVDRAGFRGICYYDYDPRWRVPGVVEPAEHESHTPTLTGDGPVTLTRVALVRFTCPPGSGRLSLYWIEGYGGGLFLPFRDASSGATTYHAGRYLLDTTKGANLGLGQGEIVLDFNYAYTPSCGYSDRWACPLAPRENWLSFEVPVGERRFER